MINDAATSIAKNTTIMMGSQGITWLSSFVLMLFLPRYLGSEDFGRLYLAISLTMIFQIVIDFGGPYYIAKEIARYRERAPFIIANSLALRGLLWALSLVAMLAVAMAADYSGVVVGLVLILGVAKLWEAAGRVFNSSFQAFEMMQYPSLGAIVERVFIMMAGVAALLMGAHSIVIALLMSAGTFLNFSVTGTAIRRFVPAYPRIRADAMKRLLKEGTPYFLWSIFAVVYYRIDAVMLSVMTPGAVVGWYGAAYRFFDILMFLPSIFSWAVFPVLSRLNEGREADLDRVTRKSLDLIILAGVPVAVTIFAFSREIIALFFGLEEYAASAAVLRIFSAGLLLVYVDFILGTTLFASDKQRQWTVVALIAVGVNPLLNFFMIPATQSAYGNGGIGAAFATLLTELFVMVSAFIIMPRHVFAGYRPSILVKAAAGACIMAVSLWALDGTGLFWMAQGVIAIAAYAVTAIAARALSPEEMVFFQKFFSFRNLKNLFAFTRGAGA